MIEPIDKEVIRYVFNYCKELMTDDERSAHLKFYSENEINERGGTQFWKDFYIKIGRLKIEYTESVTNLLKDGIHAFELNTTIRIIAQHPNHPLLNYCPQCGKLARTPQAKQCRFCLHSWRSAVTS